MLKFKEFLAELSNPQALGLVKHTLGRWKDDDIQVDDTWKIQLSRILKERGFTGAGAGSFASVYKHKNLPYVLKIFRKDGGFLTWYKFAMQNQNNIHVPRFRGKMMHLAGSFYAIRVEKLVEWKVMKNKFTAPDDFTKWTKHNMIGWDPESKDAKEVVQFMLSQKSKLFLDFDARNVMFRGDTPVIIDPFADFGTYDRETRKTTPNVDFEAVFKSL